MIRKYEIMFIVQRETSAVCGDLQFLHGVEDWQKRN